MSNSADSRKDRQTDKQQVTTADVTNTGLEPFYPAVNAKRLFV